MQKSLEEIFSEYAKEKSIFKDKEKLTVRFSPENIPHRNEQIKQIAFITAPVLRNEKPSNIFMYGKTGSGKTLIIKNIIDKLEKTAKEHDSNVKIIYINCKMRKVTDTEYRLLAQLLTSFGEDVPYTGLPTDELYKRFYATIDTKKVNIVLVLDEVDALIKKIGDSVLYNLTRINQGLERTNLTLVGISNNINFIEDLDPRVKSSLSEEEITFPPYNAKELKDILSGRVSLAFNPGTVANSAVAKCAALAAQEHGDARKALDLLRVAGELAEREGFKKVEEKHVDRALKKLDTDRIMEITRTAPKHSQAVLLAIVRLHTQGNKNIQTGDVYDLYVKICRNNHLTSLTQRRVSDLISELDMSGVVNAPVKSHGRYGRTRNINLALSERLVENISILLAKEFS